MAGDADSGDSDLLSKKQEFLESFFKKGAEFTQELLRDNERLRRQLIHSEGQLDHLRRQDASAETLQELVEKLHSLEEERKSLLARFAESEAQGGSFSARYSEIEQENSDLASLYVAQSQLFASLDVAEVLRVIIEIVLNFIGGNRIALIVADGAGKYQVLASEAIDEQALAVVTPGNGVIGESIASGAIHIAEDPLRQGRNVSDDPAVVLPLREGPVVVGAVAIWEFWVQKEGLVEVDRQMFDLLSSCGGRALEAARLATIGRTSGASSPGTYEEYSELLR